MLKTSHTTTETLCKAAQGIIQPRTDTKLHALPYQFQSPETTQWWLAREGARPTYHLVKYHFARSGGGVTPWIVGIVAEKGLGQPVEEFCTNANQRNQVMTPSWQWWSFIKDLKGDHLAEAINQVLQTTALELRIDTGSPYVPGQDYNPRAPQPRYDKVWYSVHADGKLEVCDKYLGLNRLNPLTRATSLHELGNALESLSADPQFAFHWVDLLLGTALEAAQADCSEDAAHQQDEELVRWVLMPLLPWVVGDHE